MTAIDLIALAKALEGDLAASRVHRQQAQDFVVQLDSPGAATVVAASLHHYYGAIEALTERAMRAFGHTIPGGPRWHVDLLELACLDIEGARPALFGSASREALLELLSFRHFFRHAYAVAWDRDRLRRNCHVMLDAAPDIERDVQRFAATLRAAASSEA